VSEYNVRGNRGERALRELMTRETGVEMELTTRQEGDQENGPENTEPGEYTIKPQKHWKSSLSHLRR